ncbi:hypothetical protein KIN20_005060 [Parelaphostrongylus tenuis]|uniref:Uncharacterized protein n=1 Tax=Parelaphostrongylus tenuis TaxID=148309 RepID=A0AAD5QEV0_PARTN|nr:hypothetical protein KIN20_005060 [Parelaphostrongylus tenuis]
MSQNHKCKVTLTILRAQEKVVHRALWKIFKAETNVHGELYYTMLIAFFECTIVN